MTSDNNQGWRDGYAGSAPRSHDSDYMSGYNRGRTLQISEYDDERHGHGEPSGGHMPRGHLSSCLLRSFVLMLVFFAGSAVISLIYSIGVDADSLGLVGLAGVLGLVWIVGTVLFWLLRIAIPR